MRRNLKEPEWAAIALKTFGATCARVISHPRALKVCRVKLIADASSMIRSRGTIRSESITSRRVREFAWMRVWAGGTGLVGIGLTAVCRRTFTSIGSRKMVVKFRLLGIETRESWPCWRLSRRPSMSHHTRKRIYPKDDAPQVVATIILHLLSHLAALLQAQLICAAQGRVGTDFQGIRRRFTACSAAS